MDEALGVFRAVHLVSTLPMTVSIWHLCLSQLQLKTGTLGAGASVTGRALALG